MPGSQPTAHARLAAAEARFHRSAANLERVSLDAVDRSIPATETPLLSHEERMGLVVAEVTRRYQENRRDQ